MYKKILVALDTQEFCDAVFEEALSIAQSSGAALLLLSVLSPAGDSSLSPMMYPGLSGYPFSIPEATWNAYQERYQAYQTKSLDRLTRLENKAIARGVQTYVQQEVGQPGPVICKIAQQEETDLVVVGNHGRRGVDEFIMGSVSSYVMHRAACSVLVARAAAELRRQSQALGSIAAVS